MREGGAVVSPQYTAPIGFPYMRGRSESLSGECSYHYPRFLTVGQGDLMVLPTTAWFGSPSKCPFV